MLSSALVSLALVLAAQAQQIGTATPEVHPAVTWEKCGLLGCEKQNGAVVLDANYRWVHDANFNSCNLADPTVCPDAATCSANCALEGADYAGSYDVTPTTAGNGVTLGFANGGSRLYLLEDDKYVMFKALNNEFSFDVDVSNLPCGMNGALYFSEMVADGGLSATNKAGAAYGTGYCDAQCSGGTNFFNGTANVNHTLGACCNEMDLWEANSATTALTPHPCAVTGTFACQGAQCSDLCDPDGCDFNPFRLGNHNFYGTANTNQVDTSKPFTVITQFITNDGTSHGKLAAINRLYVQNGRLISQGVTKVKGVPTTNVITENFCDAKEKAFGDPTFFDTYGGLERMGEALGRGVVLVMSLWNDQSSGMLWLDGVFPVGSNSSTPGVFRGPCSATSGATVNKNSSVTFSNIRFGEIGSTVLAAIEASL